jgi:hypothetical protein
MGVVKFHSFQTKILLVLMELLRKYNEKIDVKLLKKQTALNRCDMIERSLGEKILRGSRRLPNSLLFHHSIHQI